VSIVVERKLLFTLLLDVFVSLLPVVVGTEETLSEENNCEKIR